MSVNALNLVCVVALKWGGGGRRRDRSEVEKKEEGDSPQSPLLFFLHPLLSPSPLPLMLLHRLTTHAATLPSITNENNN